jgi:ribosomal protein S18 acetylase RimI-like enzyme
MWLAKPVIWFLLTKKLWPQEVQGFVLSMSIQKKSVTPNFVDGRQEKNADLHAGLETTSTMTYSASAEEGNCTFDVQPLRESEDVWKFLAVAAHEADMQVVKSNPDLERYAQDFSDGDIGFVAIQDGDIKTSVGAAWVRFWSDNNCGYGFVRSDIPELAIGVDPRTGKGIGSTLLRSLIDELSVRKIPAVSLSFRGDNPALRLYKRFRFQTVPGTEVSNRVGGESFSMILWLPQVRPATQNDLSLILKFIQKRLPSIETLVVFKGSPA